MYKIYLVIRIINRCVFIEASNNILLWFFYISSAVERDKWALTEDNSEYLARAPALILPLSFLIAVSRKIPASLVQHFLLLKPCLSQNNHRKTEMWSSFHFEIAAII